jgi:dTDP-4-dehydrorhamnose 3,5-epimerase-like enzyme
MLKIFNLSDIQTVLFPLFQSPASYLVVYEGNTNIPFNIARVFTIKATTDTTRGLHVHKECSQLLVVLEGECYVICDDGKEKKEFILNKSDCGILIPPTIWAEQQYKQGTILMVLTDKTYDESDYIRNYDDFLQFREQI